MLSSCLEELRATPKEIDWAARSRLLLTVTCRVHRVLSCAYRTEKVPAAPMELQPLVSRTATMGVGATGLAERASDSRWPGMAARKSRLALGRVRVRGYGANHDLGAAVAAQMREVADRLPVQVAHAALARYGFVEA